MADNLPVNFPIPQEESIATYNYNDLVSGEGIVVFDGFASKSSGAAEVRGLSTSTLVSDPNNFGTTANQTKTETFYGSTFNTQRVLNGRCFVALGLRLTHISGTITAKVHVTLKHYHAATDSSTDLGDEWTVTEERTGGDVLFQEFVYIDVTKEVIKKGDRIDVELSLVTTGGTGTFNVYHNPENEALGGSVIEEANTYLKVTLPFEINL